MSAWQRPDSPIELPDGTLCCSAHYLSYCPICCVDYTFMEDLSESGNNSYTGENRENVVVSTPAPMPSNPRTIKRFCPPSTNDTPQSLFTPDYSPNHFCLRFVRRTDPREMLIYTDGSCLNNGQQSPTAGCAFIFGPISPAHSGSVHFRLDLKGPAGVEHLQTSNRAELRAVIAALQFRAWYGEGFERVVIATDSDYVVSGITAWINTWVRKGWVTSKNTAVKNRDLWEVLLNEVELHRYQNGLEVLFWHIPRKLNTDADRLAKQAAAVGNVRVEYGKIIGLAVQQWT
ncbi:hypothetical protein MMC24_005127 [Lignoscripta atroalba]|nr:hypothetical protein [Lignoscripta atroalba]